VVGRDPLAVWGRDFGSLLSGLPFTLHQAANANGFTRIARWVLPAASHMEKDATFMNFSGVVQRGHQALEPLGSSRPDWWIFGRLLRGMGSEFPYDSARQLFEALASRTPAFAGLDFDAPGPAGRAWEPTPRA